MKEKRINLNDDFIKFIRFAQWRIERTHKGMVAFVTNNVYIDGLTHRRMRQSLLETFDIVYILDLHGSSRKQETSPDGSPDENVFDIQQGVSICLCIKHSSEPASSSKVFHRSLWGNRETKYQNLLSGDLLPFASGWEEVKPIPPHFFFVPKNFGNSPEYETFDSINTDIFPLSNAGIQTKRDDLVYHFTVSSLNGVLDDLEKMPVEEFRAAYNLPPDGRDWTIANARADLLSNKGQTLQVDYHPFDARWTYYTGKTKGIMAYPRFPLMGNLIHDNLAILTIRNSRRGNVNCFFVSQNIVDKDAISSFDNVTFFPLYIYPDTNEAFDDKEKDWQRTGGRHPNLTKTFVAQFAGKLSLEFVTDGRGDLQRTFGPEDVFHYAYTIFYSPAYRERYTEQLKIDFPRLPLTTDVELFRQLVAFGVDLVALHLLEDNYGGTSWQRQHEPSPMAQPITRFVRGTNGTTVGPMSKSRAYDAELKRIYLDTSGIAQGSYFQFLDTISSEDAQETWEFQVGGYQVLHKWLYDRRPQGNGQGRTLTDEELDYYQRIVGALFQTRKLMTDIDKVISEHGGFPLPDIALLSLEEPKIVEEKEVIMSNSDWREPQPKLIITDSDQLPLGHSDADNSDDENEVYDSSVELMTLNVLSADNALTQLEGLEVEGDDPDETTPIMRPFDPAQIRMNTQQMSLDTLINRMRDGRISIPRYQRAEGIWSNTKKSRLIESILIRIPLPAFYIDASDDENWRIIDGLQRLTTLRLFIIEKSLRLSGLEFLGLNDVGYDDLQRSLQRRVEETQITVYFVQEGTPEAVTYNIFKRINTGGESLSPQEIRNAVHYGTAVPFLDKLAKSEPFLRATGYSIKSLRRADQEVVLRFFAFAMSPERHPRTNDIDAVMNDTMVQVNKMTDAQRDILAQRFTRAMNAAYSILGAFAFRKIMPSGRRGQVSRALYDAWAMNFDALSDEQINRLSQKRPSSRLLARFKVLLKDDADFNRSITASTGDPARVQYRYDALNKIIHETLGPDYA